MWAFPAGGTNQIPVWDNDTIGRLVSCFLSRTSHMPFLVMFSDKQQQCISSFAFYVLETWFNIICVVQWFNILLNRSGKYKLIDGYPGPYPGWYKPETVKSGLPGPDNKATEEIDWYKQGNMKEIQKMNEKIAGRVMLFDLEGKV